MPFPARQRAIVALVPWIGASVGAQLVTVPCALVVSGYVGTGAAAYATAAATGAVCAMGAWLGATRASYAVAPDAPPTSGRPALIVATVAGLHAALAVAVATRLADHVDPAAPTVRMAVTYAAAVGAALLSTRRRL